MSLGSILTSLFHPAPPEGYSKNEWASKVMGYRETGCTAIDYPCELGYHCPVCQVDGNYDERLEWSEYNSFIWCSVCNRDYPSALCMPEVDKAIDVFLSSVEDAVAHAVSERSEALRP